MGQSSSSLPSSLPELALHCLRVAEHSPAASEIEPFFDYLVGIETPDHPFDAEAAPSGQGKGQGLVGLSPAALGRVLEDNEGKRVGLRVYNAKSQRIRGDLVLPTSTECLLIRVRSLFDTKPNLVGGSPGSARAGWYTANIVRPAA
jgi:hypothetical protein